MSYELMSNPNYANNDADDTRWNVISSTEDITQHIDLLLSEAEQEANDIGINDIFDDADDQFDNGSDIFDKMTELDTEAVNEAANNIDDTVFDDDICSLATGHAGIIVNPDVYSTSSAKQSHTSYTNDDYEQASKQWCVKFQPGMQRRYSLGIYNV